MEEVGLTPAAEGPRATLIRRLYLDLIGLPPTSDEVSDYVTDISPTATTRVIDGLLARPEFGERWARPWLDLARYADSHGFQRDDFRDLWAYRDWVINSLNADMPFDQFTIEQLAGDLLPDATTSQRVATGFHRCAPTNVEAGSIPEETRTEQVLDRVNTTATVWLGSTLECAQCHDHKYDPFTMRDYYRMFAFFNHTELEADLKNPNQPSSIAFIGPTMELVTSTFHEQRQSLLAQQASLQAKRAEQVAELEVDLPEWANQQKGMRDSVSKAIPLEVVQFDSQGSTDSYRIREDRAILIVGDDPPETDVYVVRGRVQGSDIRAIRLDALTDESIPGGGPGRGGNARSNFVLHEFQASVVSARGAMRKLSFQDARCDFAQTKWEVSGAIDGSLETGWAVAPQFARDHWATFVLDQPLDATEGIELEVTLTQNFGGARTMGCFKLTAISGTIDEAPLPQEIHERLLLQPATWTPSDRKELAEFRARSDTNVQAIDTQLASFKRQLANSQLETTLVMKELKEPRETRLLMRGDYRNPGDTVTAGVPEFLGSNLPRAEHSRQPNRLDLARWLVSPTHPLTARVTVNRWWSEFFGAGLVRTPEDFGLKGDPPTHPELLDWLAVDLVESGWSMKHTLRQVTRSATYQQSSVGTDRSLADDPENRLLARGPRTRLDAETIRDNALAIAELLSRKMNGPSIRPYQPEGVWVKVGGQSYPFEISPGEDAYRRGVYVVLKRGAPYPSFINFDASNRLACTVQRSRTNTPLQALTLLNDPVFVEATKAIARRAAISAKSSAVRATISDEFRRCVAREPSQKELDALTRLYDEGHDRTIAEPIWGDALARDQSLPKDVTSGEFAAWYNVATVLLNLHETITKE
jgi:hypothetical protein